MANFRRNHKGCNASSNLMKYGVFGVVFLILFYLFNPSDPKDIELPFPDDVVISNEPSSDQDYLPSSIGQVVYHKHYTLSYIEKHEQPEWVAYKMTKDQLMTKHVERTNNFRIDPLVNSKSATIYDYKRSGYDRGHLAPAGDMAFTHTAMSETFFMSNMSPQVHNFNGGVWRELEEQTRDWAKSYKELYIVTGPILNQKPFDVIGQNDVSVPAAYYKVVLDVTGPDVKGIGFIMKNEVSTKPLQDFAMSIDEVEKVTGINFYENFKPNTIESIESDFDINKWRFSKKRFDLRVQKWNLR